MKPKKPIKAWGILNKDGKFNPYWIFASKKDLKEFIDDSSCKIIPIYISFTKPE